MADSKDLAPLAVLADFLAEHGQLELLSIADDPVRELIGLRQQLAELREALRLSPCRTPSLGLPAGVIEDIDWRSCENLLELGERLAARRAALRWEDESTPTASTLRELAELLKRSPRVRVRFAPGRPITVRAWAGPPGEPQQLTMLGGDSLTIDGVAGTLLRLEQFGDVQAYLDDSLPECTEKRVRPEHSFVPLERSRSVWRCRKCGREELTALEARL